MNRSFHTGRSGEIREDEEWRSLRVYHFYWSGWHVSALRRFWLLLLNHCMELRGLQESNKVSSDKLELSPNTKYSVTAHSLCRPKLSTPFTVQGPLFISIQVSVIFDYINCTVLYVWLWYNREKYEKNKIVKLMFINTIVPRILFSNLYSSSYLSGYSFIYVILLEQGPPSWHKFH